MPVDNKPSDMYHARLVSMTFMAYSATTGFRIPDTDSGACTHSQTHVMNSTSTIQYNSDMVPPCQINNQTSLIAMLV